MKLRSFNDCARVSELLLELLIGVLLFALMMVTVIDVVGRYFVNMPLRGSVELTEVLLAIMIFSALPLVTARSSHVSVDLFKFLVPDKAHALQLAIVNILSGMALLVLATELFQRAERVLGYGEHTAYLKIPVGLVIYYLALLTVVIGIVFISLPIAQRLHNK